MLWVGVVLRETCQRLSQSNLFLEYIEEIYQTFLEAMNTANCLGDAVK